MKAWSDQWDLSGATKSGVTLQASALCSGSNSVVNGNNLVDTDAKLKIVCDSTHGIIVYLGGSRDRAAIDPVQAKCRTLIEP